MPAGGAATATVADTYTLNPGVLVVNKTITGAAAGDQGAVRIHVDCGVGFVFDFDIDADTAARQHGVLRRRDGRWAHVDRHRER